MSERFVRGWEVSLPELRKLVGGDLTARQVLASKSNARFKKDVFMTLGEGDAADEVAEGKEAASGALTSVLGGELDEDLEYEYARVLELILNHAAKPLTGEIYLGLTYHVPHDDPGCWGPFLKAVKLPQLAKSWAADTLKWPWPKRALGTGWPIWSELAPAPLAKIKTELAALTRAKLETIPAKLLTDRPGEADATRDELWTGLARLRTWVTKIRKGNSLVLSMDGDQ